MIDENEIREFERAIRFQYIDYLYYIEDTCRMLFKQAIVQGLYNYYQQKVYKRTGSLVNSVSSKVVGETLYLYIDYSKLHYTSAVTNGTGIGDDVSFDVPWFLTNQSHGRTGGTDGHHDVYANTIGGQYHSYERRKYLEMGQQLIKNRFGIDAVIINNQDDYEF